MTVVLLSFLAVVNARTRDVVRQTTLTDLEEVSHLITSELAYTIRFEDGYQRTFQLPHTLDGLPYAAQIRGQRDLVLETGELQHVAFLESPVVGQLRRGPNTLTKGNGGQLFLNVDTAPPQIEIDGNETDWAIRFVSSLNSDQGAEVNDQVAADCGGAGNCDSANTAAAPNQNELTDFFAAHDEDTLSFKVKYAPGSAGANFLEADADLNTAIFIDADNDRATGYASSGFADLFPATGFGADYVLLDPSGTIPDSGGGGTAWRPGDLPGGLYKYVSADPARQARALTDDGIYNDDWLLVSPLASAGNLGTQPANTPADTELTTAKRNVEYFCFDAQSPPRRIVISQAAFYARNLLPGLTPGQIDSIFPGKNPVTGEMDFGVFYGGSAAICDPLPDTLQRVACTFDPPVVADGPFYMCFGLAMPAGLNEFDETPYAAVGGSGSGTPVSAYRMCRGSFGECDGVWNQINPAQAWSFEYSDSSPVVDYMQCPAPGCTVPVGPANWVEMNVSFSTMSLAVGNTIHLLLAGLDANGGTNKIDLIPPHTVPQAAQMMGGGTYYLI